MGTATERSAERDDEDLVALAEATGLIDAAAVARARAAVAGGSGAVAALIEAGVDPRAARALRGRQRREGGHDRIDRWRILGTLGVGGTSVVLRAVDDAGRRAALKVLSPSVAADPAAAERLLREARALASVSHPNLVGILGSGRIEGRLWLALELMDGGDASARLAHGALPEADALRIVRDAARGAQALHAVGLVHRDIKPGNVFLAADGTAKLADLGLAKGEAPDDQLTRPGLRVGTPAYMAPEQVTCAPLDARTDVYALGATLFHLVTGKKPFRGQVPDMLRAIMSALAPPDPLAVRPDVSSAAVAILRRAMQPRAERRYQDAGELVADLDATLAGRRLPSATARRRLLGALRGVGRRLRARAPAWMRTRRRSTAAHC